MSNNEKLEYALKEIKKKFPNFCWESSVEKAFKQCSYMETFPEDYNDDDFDVGELKSQLQCLKYGFEALFDLFVVPVPSIYKISVFVKSNREWKKNYFYLKGFSRPTEKEALEILKTLKLLKECDCVEYVQKVEEKDKENKIKLISNETFNRYVIKENGKNTIKYMAEKEASYFKPL